MSPAIRSDITMALAAFGAASRWQDHPADVRRQAVRALVNWTGVTIGGARHPAIDILVATIEAASNSSQARLLGRHDRLGMADAALVNCMASAVHTYDDTHYSSISHPGGPVIASVMALAETRRVAGYEALNALVTGIEIASRLGNVLVRPPARGNVNLFMTSITGGIGAAAAAARILELDTSQTAAAMGIAAAQACGVREMHGTMTSSFMCGHAARCGLMAALLAERRFTASVEAIEGEKGFANIFSYAPDLKSAVDNLGTHFELLSLAFKPYPCGVAAHAAIDAALECKAQKYFCSADIAACEVQVHPVALTLMGRRIPGDALQAQVSVYHWIGAALATGRAGLVEGQDKCVADKEIAGLRERIVVTADDALAPHAARMCVLLRDGTQINSVIEHCRGSACRPMTDDELATKFRAQVEPLLGVQRTDQALGLCWSASDLADISTLHDVLTE